MKKILITGAKGFLGSNSSRHLHELGHEVYGIGHGSLSKEQLRELGLKHWKEADISIQSILEIEQLFDIIIHCGGGGSVGYSIEHPKEDYQKTVVSTHEVLEFMRLHNPLAHLIYPSSPAVQGEHSDEPISEDFIGKPTSPYGYHKKNVEDLCIKYSDNFGLNISVVRLFSVYGNGLKKQLLWDACKKIVNSREEAIFLGSGKETRDFIHITDVLALFDFLMSKKDKFLIINGGTGFKYTVLEIVEMIRDLINPKIKIKFNNKTNKGNPIYYWADVRKLQQSGFSTIKKLKYEIKEYVDWVISLND